MAIKIITGFIMIIALTGCLKKIDCPAYPNDMLVWMPYHENQEIVFTDGTSTRIVKVTEFTKSEEHEEVSQPGDNRCNSDAHVSTFTADSAGNFSIFSNFGYDNSTGFSYTIGTGPEAVNFPFSISGNQVSDPFNNDGYSVQLLDNFNNGNKTYINVIELKYDTLRIPVSVHRLYIAKSVGLIQYESTNGAQKWILQH